MNPYLGVPSSYKNVIHKRINIRVLKFFDRKYTMTVDEDPFPPVATGSVNSIDLQVLIEESKRNMVGKKYID